jgi:hypothetical protein
MLLHVRIRIPASTAKRCKTASALNMDLYPRLMTEHLSISGLPGTRCSSCLLARENCVPAGAHPCAQNRHCQHPCLEALEHDTKHELLCKQAKLFSTSSAMLVGECMGPY